MMARLVYLVDGQEFELEKMNLEELDSLTYGTFDSEIEIINSSRYQDKIGDLPKDGEIKIAYDGFDVLIKSFDYLGEFGFNPFMDKQYMSVLVGERKIKPTIRSLKETIIRTLCDIDVLEEFYETFRDKYTPYEVIMFSAGMLYNSNKLVAEGIKRIINEVTDHSDGYFVGRVFLDGLSNFESVKNKDDKGRLVSPIVFEKK